jgi:hypothetical protein
MKTKISTEKVEVIKKIRLTTNQHIALTEMQNNKGRSKRLDWAVRSILLSLGLIEEREYSTPLEKRVIERAIIKSWKHVEQVVRRRKLEELSRAVSDLESKHRDLSAKCYWLTPAANEYLTTGTVTITR